jgi:hypothetical protein
MSHIRAIGNPPRRGNAELIADLAQLGYLPEPVIDVTYGKGRFWKLYRPEKLVTNDLDPISDSMLHHDFTNFPAPDRLFATVVFDPPYKLNGTASQGGPATSDDDYGVGGDYRTPAERHDLMRRGMTEAARMAREFVIVKCMDQVVSGRIHWQTDMMTEHGRTIGLNKIDTLHVYGYRTQPAGRRQVHAHRDYSTALVFAVLPEPPPQLI